MSRDFLAEITDPRLKAQALTERDRHAAIAEYDSLSQGEHPDVLEDAHDIVAATDRLASKAHDEYTNPFGVSKTVPVFWPFNGSLDSALTLG